MTIIGDSTTNGSTVTDSRRYFVSEKSKESKYVLPADEEERTRLNEQGDGVVDIFDNKLIWAPVTLKDGDIVLDSGTGSGQWILSVAKEVPQTIQLRGIDLELRMFPPNPPPNVTASVNSITSLPEDWSNSITLIHQRLLCAALQEDQWKAAIKEMYRTLVPGGWIQLFEPNYPLASPDSAITNHPIPIMRDKLCFDVRKVTFDIATRLPGWLEEAGFVGLQIEKRGLPLGSWAGQRGRKGGQATLNFFKAIKEAVEKEDWFGLAKSGEEYDELVVDLERKCNETPETYFVYHAHVAQKPL